MNSTIENFKKYKPLLFELVSRDLKTKYRRSVLGVLWTVLNPLGMMLVMTVVFSTVFRQNIENFPVYLMCGQLVFNFFNEASNMAMTSILGNASLIKKVYVPKYLFPLSRVCSSLVNMLTSFIALIIVIIVTRTPVTWTIITAVFPVLYVSMFAFGVGLVLATAVVTFRGSAASVWCCDHGMAVSDTDLLSDFHAAGVDRTPYQAESDHVVCGIVALCCFI